jgi:VIT1/CCC1 family predicted Fe2+/Mn2+ transporter
MAAGEYVSVSSQADTERADFALERKALSVNKEGELEELADIYVGRGVEPTFAGEVARQLTARDAVGAHARDELGISPISRSAADSGGDHLRQRRRHASFDRRHSTRGKSASFCRRSFCAVPRALGWLVSMGRRT